MSQEILIGDGVLQERVERKESKRFGERLQMLHETLAMTFWGLEHMGCVDCRHVAVW